MKITSFIASPLLIASLLLGGCSGLDDDDDEPPPPPPANDFDGAYEFTLFPPLEESEGCTFALGILRINDSNVTGEATDRFNGETVNLSGSVESDGFIKGALDFSFADHSGTYNGLLDSQGSISEGTWKDNHDCFGTWSAEVVN